MACSPVPRCSQRLQQQTAECLLGSGVRGTVETAAAWLPAARREADSVDSKVRAIALRIELPSARAFPVHSALDCSAGAWDGPPAFPHSWAWVAPDR